MVKLDHLTLFVRDVELSRDWYVNILALRVEFDVPAVQAVALQDTDGFGLFLQERAVRDFAPSCILTFRVDDIEAKCRELAALNIDLDAPPQKLQWGYGAEITDPDGYVIRLWDEKSMREKG
jgi:catechol 2,3-dioxygenase-like lactoylglutathione lyase family enzyme